MFVNRLLELDQLNQLIGRSHPGPGQLLLVYGRRRIGKSALLTQWGRQSGLRYIHWSVQQAPADLQRQRMFSRILNVPVRNAPTFHSWEELWDAVFEQLASEPTILVIDEIPYAIKEAPELESSLQHAWDRHFKNSNVIFALCGSQIQVMETIGRGQSPVGGRFTSFLHVQDMPFSSLGEFFPQWSVEEQIAAFSITGGIPAYMEWLDPQISLDRNIKDIVLSPGSAFLTEPEFLLADDVRDPGPHLAVLQAIGRGMHEFGQISTYSHVDKTALPKILSTLQELRLIERILPATLPPPKQKTSRRSKYHIKDNYLKFFFQFVAPYQDRQFSPDLIMEHVRSDFRSFVGRTAFEELCRTWVRHQNTDGKLGMSLDAVGTHWSKTAHVDVVGVNWAEKQVVIGECKWGDRKVGRGEVQTLLSSRVPDVLDALPGDKEEWQVHSMFFSRRGLTSAAEKILQEHGGKQITAQQLVVGL